VGKHQLTTTELAAVPRVSGARALRVLSLVYTEGDEPLPRRVVLERGRLVIGRDPGAGGFELDDGRASRRHAEIVYVAEIDGYRIDDLDSRNGTYLDGRKISSDFLVSGSVMRLGSSMLVYSEVSYPDGMPLLDVAAIGASSLARAHAEASSDLAAKTKMSILISGPTGAGKEILAQRIHQKSGRSGPLIAINCATFSRELIGSELFGHTAGAFSGAKTNRAGLFASADGGTLFLDEVAELPLDQQPALLRALQEGKVRPVGSDHETSVDVRVIAATHQPLDELREQGKFRADLFARLAGFSVELPGLLERREEILALFTSFLGGAKRPLSIEAAEALLLYSWPLNVRELKHAAERAMLYSTDRVELAQLPPALQRPSETAEAEESDSASKEQLIRLLAEHDGNIARVARATGKHRQQIYRWMRKLGLDPSRYR
jgi:transcriptional regulator of acetoin/glycerol metabolism